MSDPISESAVRSRFESIGLYLPETSITTEALVDQMKVPLVFDLVGLTGIERRRKRSEQEDTVSIALAAARDCLSRSRYTAADLDVIVSCSISRLRGAKHYFFEPAISLWIKNELGAPQAINFDVANACAGMATGVHLLDSLIRSGVARRGMVVSGECNSAIFETAVQEIASPIDEQLPSLTVGDAGSAVIMDGEGMPTDGIEYVEMVSCTEGAYLCLGMPSRQTEGVALYTKNMRMHAKDRLLLWPHFLQQILHARGLSLAEEGFDHSIPHQVGQRFTDKGQSIAAEVLGETIPPPIHVFKDLGNTSSTAHFVALYLALQDGRVKSGDKILMAPAASGVIIGCISTTVSGMGF